MTRLFQCNKSVRLNSLYTKANINAIDMLTTCFIRATPVASHPGLAPYTLGRRCDEGRWWYGPKVVDTIHVILVKVSIY